MMEKFPYINQVMRNPRFFSVSLSIRCDENFDYQANLRADGELLASIKTEKFENIFEELEEKMRKLVEGE